MKKSQFKKNSYSLKMLYEFFKYIKKYYKSFGSLIDLVAERRARLSPREVKKAARIAKSSELNWLLIAIDKELERPINSYPKELLLQLFKKNTSKYNMKTTFLS